MEKTNGHDHYLIIDWKYAILMITLILSVGLTIWSISMNYIQRQEIYSLRVQMSNLTSSINADTSDLSDQYLNYYMDLSHKADVSIDRVITVVIFLFGISTASGLFLAFRAPKDIEKSIDNANVSIASISETVKSTKSQLDTQVQDARASAKNAETSAEEARKATKDIEFQLWLHEATDEKNCIDKLDKLNNLIDKYPDEYFHYFERSQISNRKIQDVLRDLEFARERGLPEFIYYNAIAATYAQNDDNSKAIVNFDLSLEIEPNCGFVLANRGQCHCNIGETYLENKMFDEALSEFQLAIEDLNSAECNGEETALGKL